MRLTVKPTTAAGLCDRPVTRSFVALLLAEQGGPPTIDEALDVWSGDPRSASMPKVVGDVEPFVAFTNPSTQALSAMPEHLGHWTMDPPPRPASRDPRCAPAEGAAVHADRALVAGQQAGFPILSWNCDLL